MWEVINYITKYVIEEGGIWGLLAILAISWVSVREFNILKEKRKDLSCEKNKIEEVLNLTRERQEEQIKNMDASLEKLSDINIKIIEISMDIENFSKVNRDNNKKIEKLTNQLQQVNDERVEELKELLSSYNSTMNELSITLQKIKFVLKTKLGED